MAYAQALSPTPQAFRSFPFIELRQSLPSQIPIISPFVDQLMRFIARFRNSDGSELDIEMALREALANAIVHGNQRDPRKYVRVACRCTTDGEVSITVEDEGKGFDTDSVADPTTPENRLLTQGRGIYLMKALMDEVVFEQRGALVYMRKASNSRPRARQSRADHTP
jgi:serine/threonine-protein kinase RsbW